MADHALADLPLNCPRCGRRMRYLRARDDAGRTVPEAEATIEHIHVYECAEHGMFHFSRDMPVRPGA